MAFFPPLRRRLLRHAFGAPQRFGAEQTHVARGSVFLPPLVKQPLSCDTKESLHAA